MARTLILALALILTTAAMSRAQVALNLRDAELRSFVEIVSSSSGRNFILDPRVRGTVTVFAPASVSSEALFEIFLNVLELNKLTIVEGREADRIVPLDIARELSGDGRSVQNIGAYETRVIEVRNISLSEVVEVIRPLLPQEAVLSIVPASRLLILSDRKENHDRIARLVKRLDKPRQRTVETIRLRNGSATELLQTLQSLDITPPDATISSDARANAIVVSGNDDFRAHVRNVVSQLDTPRRNLNTAVVRLNYADAVALEPVVARSYGATIGEGDAKSTVTVVADPQSNSLVITAPNDRLQSIVNSIRALDQRPSQVLIEAVIFELSVENFSDLTVQFAAILNGAIAGGVEFNLAGRPTLTSVVTSAIAGTATSPGSGGTVGGGAQNDNGNGLAGFLSALVSQSSARLLSTPSIMTLNNSEAEIIVAQNVPFVTGSFSTVGDSAVPNQPFQTIKREDVGLTLRVTPQITADRTIRMAVHQEVSSLTNTASAAGGEITSKRTLRTNVLVRDGRVIMLGGLLENGSGSVSQAVPGISNLPVLGKLFRGRNVNKSQKVLLVMLRPRVVATDSDARRLTREVARETRRASRLLRPDDDGQFPRIPGTDFPYEGSDLNQPFNNLGLGGQSERPDLSVPFRLDASDRVARERIFPQLPGALRFK